jgi:ABC-type transport system substrate-binding protein
VWWLLALASFVGDGCADDAATTEAAVVPEGTDVAEDRGEEVPAAPSEGSGPRTLVVAVRHLPDAFDPMDDLDPWARRIADALFEGLTRRHPDAAPFAAPALADRCVTQPREVYCHLRPGAVFHDDSPVTAGDVEYSLGWWLDPRRGGQRTRHGLGALRRAEIVDRPPGGAEDPDPGRWVRIGFTRDEPLALERIAAMKIVPKAAHRGHARRFARQPIGSGPMRFAAAEDDRMVLERVQPARPSGAEGGGDEAMRIIVREIRDGAQALTMLRRGEVHVVAEVSPAHIPGELAKPGMAPRFEAWTLTPPHWDLLVYNLRRGPQAGPRMRAALDGSLPRAGLAEIYGAPSGSTPGPIDVAPPQRIDLEALGREALSADWGMAGLPERPEHDDAAAQTDAGVVLDELGWRMHRGLRQRDTGSLRLSVMFNAGGGRPKAIASLLRSSWRELGIVVPYATASWSYVFGLMRRGEFEMALMRLSTGSDADLYDLLHSRGEENISGINDAALDEALEAWRAATDREGREAARAKIAARLEALRPMSVLHTPVQVMLVSSRVTHMTFVDDLPDLAALGLGPESTWIADG